MPDEKPNERRRDYVAMELEALYALTDPASRPTIWSTHDMGRELDYSDPEAVLEPLIRVGLLNTTSDGLVYATPAAFHLVSLVGHVG
jgi:hypothetical protein